MKIRSIQQFFHNQSIEDIQIQFIKTVFISDNKLLYKKIPSTVIVMSYEFKVFDRNVQDTLYSSHIFVEILRNLI